MSDFTAPSVPFVLPQSPVEADLLAKYFRGLGDPTRVRVLQLLADTGELAVAELVTRLGLSQSKVSNHLALPALVRVRGDAPRSPERLLPRRR